MSLAWKCDECNTELDGRYAKISIGDKNICKECSEKIYCKCRGCNELVKRNEANIYNDYYFCKRCFDKKFVICNDCNQIFNENCVHYIGDNTLCDGCWSEKYCICSTCETEISIYNAANVEGSRYCDSCYDERFTECNECETSIWRDDAYYDEDEDIYLCNSCRGTKCIQNYSYKPEPVFKKMPWENTLFMGLELEVENANKESAETLATRFKNFLEKEKISASFYFKSDSSIGKGFEIVSHPFTMAYAHSALKFKKILNYLNTRKFTSYESGACGIHIHLDRDFFSELEIAKLRLFFSKNREYIYNFGRREGNGDNFCQYEEWEPKKFIRNEPQEGRYWAMNLNSSRNTVELRLFRGTLNYHRFIATIQFADAISHFVKFNGITSFIYGERSYRENSWKLFLDWSQKENKYSHLLSFLNSKEEKECVL